MTSAHIFISHASKDDDFVKELRRALEGLRLSVWVDSRNLRGSDQLWPELSRSIAEARHFIVVFSQDSMASGWVHRELQYALEIERQRLTDGFRVIPLLLDDFPQGNLNWVFKSERIFIRLSSQPGGVSEALPQILAALGERLPTDYQPQQTSPQKPVEELLVELSDPKVEIIDGKRRASATAMQVYEPADETARNVESRRFSFTAPLGPIEADDLRWYLEEFFRWPVGVFKERADGIAARLPDWGKLLFDAVAKTDSAKEALNAWRNAGDGADRRFSVMVDSELPDGASAEDQAAAYEAASMLLSLPWELLHDGRGFLFHGKNPVRVRRRLPNRNPQKSVTRKLPIRILLVSPRPEEKGVAYLDHRISAKPLVEAVEALGELAKLTILSPPTFAALQAELTRAADAGQSYDVVHFDGHGVYDRKVGLGALCFEDPKDADKLEDRAMELVYAKKLAEVMRDHRIPLVFLEACQSAQTEENPSASVAASLLNEGVTSVVAMSHNVLVETAHRFVRTFYGELARGARIGSATLAGQRALQTDTYRGKIMGAGDLRLQDWFVPVLYQEAQDPRLVSLLPSEQTRQLLETQRRLSLGRLPSPPPHTFIGRSRELLKLERLLMKETPAELRYAIVRGVGGQGKTTLAVEAARWFVRTGRFRRAAFVSLEHYTDARGVLDSLGKQLLPEALNWSVAHFPDLRQALQPVERALNDHPTIIVLDNLESILPYTKSHEDTRIDEDGLSVSSRDHVDVIFALCQSLMQADERTRLLFTTREPLPEPFNLRHCEITIGALSREDAIELVGEVMRQEGLTPKHDDVGNTPQEIIDLVETVNRHARALTLMAREISRGGVRATTGDLRRLMGELHAKHPDDRENSLYASVELSLRRLPAEQREKLYALSIFHGGAYLPVVGLMMDQDFTAAERLAAALIEVGLAEMMDYGHLRLDPALPNYLLGQLSATEQEQIRSSWVEGMRGLVGFLNKQQFQNAQLAAQLTLLELPNLLALLEWAQGALTPEEVVGLAGTLESLLAHLGRPQALAQATRAREQAARALGAWSHAQFVSLRQGVELMLEQGRLPETKAAAEQLLDRALAGGEAAYAEAAYDIALAYFLLGRALLEIGATEAALAPLSEAQRRFQALAAAGNTDAERMASVAIIEAAECARDLGRYDEAAAAFEEGIRRIEKLGDRRGAAVSKGQLGTVHLLQKRYDKALERYREALEILESLGEPGSVAAVWHQIGMAHRHAGQFEQAEQAYRQSLVIKVQQQDLAGEALSLSELGNLYGQIGRLEDAATFCRQAADICARLQDQRNEGLTRGNLAYFLIKLRRYDEARRELRRTFECIQPFGHAAEPWKAWDLLHDLELANGDAQAAEAARGQAIASYMAYRRAGGESQSMVAELFALVFQAIQQGATTEVEQALDESSKGDVPAWLQRLLTKLQAILRGELDPALAADPNLDYLNAAELQLLLEGLGAK